MSTKTSIKRIALVAVSALGFGLLSVAPSSAADLDEGTYTVSGMTAATVTTSRSVGSPVVVNFGINMSNITAAATTPAETRRATFRVALQSYPAGGGSLLTTAASAGGGAALTFTGGTTGVGASAGLATITSGANALVTGADRAASATQGVFSASWTPAVAGTYVIVMWNDANRNGIVDPSEYSNTHSVSVSSQAVASTDFPDTSNTTTGLFVSSVGVTTVSPSGRVGVPVGFTPNYTLTNAVGGGADTDVTTGSPRAKLVYSVTGPTGAAVTTHSVATGQTTLTVDGGVQYVAPLQANNNVGGTNLVDGLTQINSNKGSASYFTPTAAGTYTITIYHDGGGANGTTLLRNDLRNAGEAVASISVVVAADALPSITFTKYGTDTTAALNDATDLGQLVKISLRNGSNPWSLGPTETLRLTPASTSTFWRFTQFSTTGANSWQTTAGTAGAVLDLTSANFNGSGDAWINIGDSTTAGGTFSVSATIIGGTAAGASGSFTITTFAADTTTTDFDIVNPALADISNSNVGAGVADDGSFAASASDVVRIKPGVTTAVAFDIVVGKNDLKYYAAQVTDTYGLWTGVTGAKYAITAKGPSKDAVATSLATLSVTVPGAATASLGTANPGFTIGQIDILQSAAGAARLSVTVNVATAVATKIAVNPVNQTGGTYAIRAATGSTNKFQAWVLDQFGNPMASQTVNAQITAGRNVQVLSTPLFSNSSGMVEFSVADTYTGTFLTADTLTFTSGTASSGVVTINYAAYNAPSTVTITGGASADVAPTVTYNYINAGTSGASATTVKMTATVKDASGATLPAGIPVKWAISGLAGKSAILVDATTGYDWSTSMTDSNGQAVTYVYAWGIGPVTVTATAGAVTSATPGKINFANVATDARVVSATVKGNIITAKVVGRYGNPVEGVSLTAIRNSGVGYFAGSASSSAVGTTNALGEVDFVLTGGAANVTVKTTTLNFGQTSSAAGQVNGTAIVATSIGASLAPAGVQSVTVDVTSDAPSNIAAQDAANAAADAAAEAIDAANAATDAANLAAEAADAATVAAEEARDAADAATAAVEELATQVATLMAALKAQITTLANTVAKIAKKVKA